LLVFFKTFPRDGTFDNPRVFMVGATPLAIATGDLDGDGNLDFATANSTGQTVTL
jgi:hypothetical protein